MVRVKYFASLRERFGRAEDRVVVQPGATVAEVWTRVSGGESMPAHLLMAVNLEYARPEQPVHDGDEVAFFPPVTGG
jgi:molybdopterin synthase sulfur carrier subunit